MNFKNKDIISIKDLSKPELLHIIQLARRFDNNKASNMLKGKIMASLFFEPSTRTKLSFETAMKKLGGECIGFDDISTTSVTKGESFDDTLTMVCSYADVIVIRHPKIGSATEAAKICSTPVINAGDGSNQHPTQTLVDLYTIKKELGRLDNIKIGFVGDLKYGRTVHSLAYALSHFNAEMHFISPKALSMPKDNLKTLKKEGIIFTETDDLDSVCKKLDVLYVTRIQQERFRTRQEYLNYKGVYRIDKKTLKKCSKNVRIMHPLPRVDEISTDIDKTKNAIYFKQAANGIPVRKALLALVLGKVK